MLRTYGLQERRRDEVDKRMLEGVLANIAFALRSTYHSSLQATPTQMIFGRDMLFPTQYVVDYQRIQQQKKERMQKDNARENKQRRPFKYAPGQPVLVLRDKKFGEVVPKLAPRTMGPYTVVRVFNNGTVSIQKRGFVERIHIRRLIPFHG